MRNLILAACVVVLATVNIAPVKAQSTQGRTGVPTGGYAVPRDAVCQPAFSAGYARLYIAWFLETITGDQFADGVRQLQADLNACLAG